MSAAWEVFDPRDGIARRTYRTERAARLRVWLTRRAVGAHAAYLDYAPRGAGWLTPCGHRHGDMGGAR